MPVDLALSGLRITGGIRTWGSGRIVLLRPGRKSAEFLFDAWLHHLVLCCLLPSGACTTTCITLEGRSSFAPVADARAVLGVVLEHFAGGLVSPLPFFPGTSWEYARAEGSREQKMGKARSAWKGSEAKSGERDDPYVDLCFRGREALSGRFEKVSLALFSPLLGHLSEVSR